MTHYILNGKDFIAEPDLTKWAEWFEIADRHIAKTNLGNDIKISTVFLGVDHNFAGSTNNDPILFETCQFGGDNDGHIIRYRTWDEAEKGHAAIVKWLRE